MKKYNGFGEYLFRSERKWINFVAISSFLISIVLLMVFVDSKVYQYFMTIFLTTAISYIFYIFTVEVPGYRKYRQWLIIIKYPIIDLVKNAKLILNWVVYDCIEDISVKHNYRNCFPTQRNDFDELFGTIITYKKIQFMFLKVTESHSIVQRFDFIELDDKQRQNVENLRTCLNDLIEHVQLAINNKADVVDIESNTIYLYYEQIKLFWSIFKVFADKNQHTDLFDNYFSY